MKFPYCVTLYSNLWNSLTMKFSQCINADRGETRKDSQRERRARRSADDGVVRGRYCSRGANFLSVF